MKNVSQKAYQRQRMIKYSEKHSVTKPAIRYHTSRKAVHKWKDLISAYQELVEKDGYTRSYGDFKRIAAKLKSKKPKRKKSKRKNKPYKRADYPG